jgi:hypothetical protein
MFFKLNAFDTTGLYNITCINSYLERAPNRRVNSGGDKTRAPFAWAGLSVVACHTEKMHQVLFGQGHDVFQHFECGVVIL